MFNADMTKLIKKYYKGVYDDRALDGVLSTYDFHSLIMEDSLSGLNSHLKSVEDALFRS